MVKSSSKKKEAATVASEQPQNQQCSDEHKQLSGGPSEPETKPEDAGNKIGIVKELKKRKSKKKISEQLQILQSVEALEQISSVDPSGIEINPQAAERKIPELQQIMQSGDEHKRISSVNPSEIGANPEDLEKKREAATVASEQPQNQQCSDEHKQLSAIGPSEPETKLEDAGSKIGIVKAPKKRKSKKKISEQLQILQSVDALQQISSVDPSGIEINPQAAERKIASVELPKAMIPELPQIMQSGDEHKQISSVNPSEIGTNTEDVEKKEAATVASEQPQNQQCSGEHKHLSAVGSSKPETKLEDAGSKIGIVKAPTKQNNNNKKISEQLPILQSVDALQQISDDPSGIEINPEDAERKIASVELPKTKIPELPQIMQSGDEHKPISSVNPSEIGIDPEDAERKTEIVEPPNKKIPEQQINQSGDENKQLSSVLPSELETKPEGAKRKVESVEPRKGKNKKKKKGSNTLDQAAKDRIVQKLNEFLASPAQDYIVEENLGGHKGRAFVHGLCRTMNIRSKSRGKGSERRVRVYKINNNGSTRVHKIKNNGSTRVHKINNNGSTQVHKINNNGSTRVYKINNNGSTQLNVLKDPLSFLKFSEESKEVLRNLFMQYPPGQDEHIQIKSNCCSKIIRKIRNHRDDFFCKPRMNKVEIAKKVEALSFKMKNDPHMAKINKQRSRLPITSSRDVIVSKVECNQVVLISGETGCGKTTQIPQFLLDKMWDAGESCKIICTQPRRISATSVAERVSQERGEVIGETVGYKIRLDSQGGRDSSLIFCTNGVLLRLLVSDGLAGSNPGSTAAASSNLSEITHIVVDEIHERDHFSDFMLAILRDLLPRYPRLRLVLMSATMDAERFSQYFDDCPIIEVPGFTFPVTSFYLEDIISSLESAAKTHSNATLPTTSSEQFELTDEHKLTFDEAIDLAWSNDEFDPLLELISSEEKLKLLNHRHTRTGVSPLMVFAAKGRVGDMCMLLSLGADCHLKGQDGSTAMDLAKLANQTEAADAISRHLENASSNSNGNPELVDKYLSRVNPDFIGPVHLERLLRKICTESDRGAILVFLAGWDDITNVKDRLLGNPFFRDSCKFQILPLHSMVPPDEQKKVFNRPPPGCRKIILSTNIAETAVTIDDVVYVIDTGKVKEKGYDPSTNLSTLQSSWVSKASVKQRAGRAGRCQPGFCYHLYSKQKVESFSEFSTPEIKRMPLEELCLQVKMLDPNYDIVEFLNKTLDPPLYETIQNAVAVLKEIGALSNEENLTKLGKQLGSLPVHPLTSKMLFFAILCNCLGPALTLACSAFFRDPFTLTTLPEKKKIAAEAKAELAALYCGHSDQLAMVAAFECWKNLKDEGQQSDFCCKYFISNDTMRMLSGMRKQLQRELKLNGYIPNNISTYNQNAQDPGIVQAVLVAGLYPNVGRVRKKISSTNSFLMVTASGDTVRVHQQSSNSLLPLRSSRRSALAVYGEISQGDGGVQVKKCSLIENLPLVLFASEIAVAPTKDTGDGVMSSADNPVVVVVDRWLSFESTALEVAQIYCLRERLSSAVLLKGTDPRYFLLSPALAASVDAITRILSLDGQPDKLTSHSVDTPKCSEGEKATDQTPSKFLKAPSEFLKNLFSNAIKPPTRGGQGQSVPFYQASVGNSQGSRKKARKSSNGKKATDRASGGNPKQSAPKSSNGKKATDRTSRGNPKQSQVVATDRASGGNPKQSAPKSSNGKKATDRTSRGNPKQSQVVAHSVNQRAHVKGSSVPSHPAGPSQPNRRLPAPIEPKLPMQQPRAVPTAPASLNGYGSSLYGPYGPRGGSRKRSRSDR